MNHARRAAQWIGQRLANSQRRISQRRWLNLPNEPIWVPFDAALTFNKQQTAETGENHALLFAEKLEGALMRPQNAWHYDNQYDIVKLTVNLMTAIPQAHPFEQGNKRTGFVSGFAFLAANGYELLPGADGTNLAVLHTEAILNEGTPGEFEEYLRFWTCQA